MKKKILSMALAVVLILGLAAPAVAAGQTFSDVPSSYWGYADIEAAAEAGLMNGTGNGKFSPNLKVSVAQFLTLLGRLVFPDTKVNEGDTWFGPYVTAAEKGGLLTGTQVNVNDVEAEISRYDMAVILRAAAKKLGVAEKAAQSSEVTDYLDIPNRYTEAVLAVYGMGLIKGDQAGNFNGSNTMVRAEVATVIMRLAKAKPGGTINPGVTTDPEKPEETEKPTEPVEPVEDKVVEYRVHGSVRKTDHAIGRPVDDKHTYLKGIPVKLYYTPDGGETSTLVAETVTDSDDLASYDITFEAPWSWVSSANYENGNGFYFSTETVLDGQRLVTSDLRTDGRAYKEVFYAKPGGSIYHDVELTPTDGEKAKFTYQGYIEAMIHPDHLYERLPGFTIQLHLADGRLVAEAVSKEDGTFSMECEVDALDGGFDKHQQLYYTTASGYFEGELYERSGKYLNSDRFILESLVELDVMLGVGGPNPRANDMVTISETNKKQ